MPGTADFIQRAPFFERLQQASQDPQSFPLDDIIAELDQPGCDIVELAQRYGLVSDPDEIQHLRREWYDDPPGTGWWPEFDTMEIVRVAYLETLRAVQQTGLSVDALWVPDQEHFSVAVCMSPRQITMVFFTPRCRELHTGPDSTIRIVEQGLKGSLLQARDGRRSG